MILFLGFYVGIYRDCFGDKLLVVEMDWLDLVVVGVSGLLGDLVLSVVSVWKPLR